VLIVTYGCHPTSGTAPVASQEHRQAGLFTRAEAAALRMPGGYQASIAAWFGLGCDIGSPCVRRARL
jgi:hypothetical protein